MGQVVLGVRSLFVKLGVFFVMAALLAWALGGTLFPRPHARDFAGVEHRGELWYWRLSLGAPPAAQMRWMLLRRGSGGEPVTVDDGPWSEVAGPIAVDGALYYGGRISSGTDAGWQIKRVDSTGSVKAFPLPDRLEVERQLARVLAGLPVQKIETTRQQRSQVLEPVTAVSDARE